MNWLKEYGTTEGPLGFPMLDKQAAQLASILQGLPKGADYEFRRVTLAKASPTELNPGERSDVSWISTECVDRDQEVMLAKGMNEVNYALNPIVTLNHSYGTPPVGRSLWRKRVRDGDRHGIKAKTFYPPPPAGFPENQTWQPDVAFRLVSAGLLNGKSIGFQPLKHHRAETKEATKNGWPVGIKVIDEWILLEYACVYLPANQEALVEQIGKHAQVDAAFLKALALDPQPVQAEPKAAAPAEVIPFTPMEEIERIIKSAISGLNLENIRSAIINDALDRVRGRV